VKKETSTKVSPLHAHKETLSLLLNEQLSQVLGIGCEDARLYTIVPVAVSVEYAHMFRVVQIK
jgi:hypothetical protein